MMNKRVRHKSTRQNFSYSKWGYIFITPFFLVFFTFTLVPLFGTIYNSFFENYRVGLEQVGPNFIGLQNYKAILTDGELFQYSLNTIIMWIGGFIPQLTLALLLAVWFTETRLKLKTGVFKIIIYLPNLIMASAFAMLFFTIFADSGPVNGFMVEMGITTEPIRFLSQVNTSRGLVSFMNFIMWFGNTCILLMAGIMGIDMSIFESAQIDGANTWKRFTKITVPMIKPILLYVLITSLIGGIQMFDIPQILTNGSGNPDRSTMTLIMYLNTHLFSKNYGLGGAVSVILFFVTIGLSLIVFRLVGSKDKEGILR